MASLNKVFLLGNLTRVPELRYTPNGVAVCEFGLATNRKYIANNQEKEEVCFLNIVVWGKQGESCQRYLEKGSTAMIEGRLQFDQWDDRETGKKRSTLRVVAERVQFIGARRDSGGQAPRQSGDHQAPQQNNANPTPQQNNANPAPQQNNANPASNGNVPVQGKETNDFPAMPNDAFKVGDDAEDDIPF